MTEYWKNRKAGKRGQGEKPITKRDVPSLPPKDGIPRRLRREIQRQNARRR